MEQLRCRTCFEITDAKWCVEISEMCYCEKTIKEVIIHLVPEMEDTLYDNDSICRNCYRTLRSSLKFIERCLEVELINAEENIQFENYDQVDDLSSKVENVGEIILVEDSNCIELEHEVEDEDVGEIILIENSNSIELEHDYYIKQEPDEFCETLNDENSPILVEQLPDSLPTKTEGSKSPVQYVFSNLLTLYKDICVDNGELESCDLPVESNGCSEDSVSENKMGEDYVGIEDCDLPLESSTCSEDLVSEIKEEREIQSCEVCSRKFTSEEHYKLHLDGHPDLICDHCGKSFKLKKSFRYHQRLHAPYAALCEFCGKTFKGSSALSLHITSIHSSELPFMCDKCPKKYKTHCKLSSHLKVVHERIEEQECQQCGKLFQSKDSCLNHYRLVHLKLKPFVCDICNREFGRKDYLRKHKAFHYGESQSSTKPTKHSSRIPKYGLRLRDPGKAVPCNICGKMIRSVHLLKIHLETHVRMKRQKCKYCSLTFKMSNNRDRHQRLHEVDPEKKFRCSICWKRMRTEEELTAHTLAHDNRPPQHSCELCGEKFHRRYLLDNHNLDKHTEPGDIEKAENEIVVKNLLEYADPNFVPFL